MTIDNFSTPAVQSDRSIAKLIAELAAPAFAVLNQLVLLKPADSLVINVNAKTLATRLRKTERSIYSSMKVLVDAGLIVRNSAKGLFGPSVTVLSSSHIARCVNQPTLLPAKTKKTRMKRVKLPKLFDFLRDDSRFSNLKTDLQMAISTAPDYWKFIKAGFDSIGFNAALISEVQSRSLATGARTGTHEPRRRRVLLSNAPVYMAKAAVFAETKNLEVSFRLDSSEHPLILLDDLDDKALALFPYPCAILETSPGSYQATLIASRQLSAAEFLLVADALIAEFGGDSGAKGNRQLRRFPGSINNKPGLEEAFVTKVISVSSRLTLTSDELELLISNGQKIRGTYALYSDPVCSESGLTRDTTLNARDIPLVLIKNQSRPKGANDESASARDFGKAIELIRKGGDDASIIREITISAGERMKYGQPIGHSSHEKYAERTVKSAREVYKPNALRITIPRRGQISKADSFVASSSTQLISVPNNEAGIL